MLQRHSIRLHEYDYAQDGAYYITLHTSQRAKLFGQIIDGQMALSALGQIAEQEWLHTPCVRPNVCLDAFVVMPDHIHAIIVMLQCADSPANCGFSSTSHTLGAIVRGYKAAVTRRATGMAGARGLAVWQHNYYEHIVRDEADLNRIRRYIAANPSRWSDDAQ